MRGVLKDPEAEYVFRFPMKIHAKYETLQAYVDAQVAAFNEKQESCSEGKLRGEDFFESCEKYSECVYAVQGEYENFKMMVPEKEGPGPLVAERMGLEVVKCIAAALDGPRKYREVKKCLNVFK